jgi:hypothetical protein
MDAKLGQFVCCRSANAARSTCDKRCLTQFISTYSLFHLSTFRKLQQTLVDSQQHPAAVHKAWVPTIAGKLNDPSPCCSVVNHRKRTARHLNLSVMQLTRLLSPATFCLPVEQLGKNVPETPPVQKRRPPKEASLEQKSCKDPFPRLEMGLAAHDSRRLHHGGGNGAVLNPNRFQTFIIKEQLVLEIQNTEKRSTQQPAMA